MNDLLMQQAEIICLMDYSEFNASKAQLTASVGNVDYHKNNVDSSICFLKKKMKLLIL